MLALAALVVFIIAAVVAFLHVFTVVQILGLFAVAFACLCLHWFGSYGGAYTWHR
jgi:hypothetical protein